jgi:hypothetical protein
MPGDWSTAIFCPIYKNGYKTECKNYREISLLRTPYKILAKIVANRLTPYMEITSVALGKEDQQQTRFSASGQF